MRELLAGTAPPRSGQLSHALEQSAHLRSGIMVFYDAGQARRIVVGEVHSACFWCVKPCVRGANGIASRPSPKTKPRSRSECPSSAHHAASALMMQDQRQFRTSISNVTDGPLALVRCLNTDKLGQMQAFNPSLVRTVQYIVPVCCPLEASTGWGLHRVPGVWRSILGIGSVCL